VGITKAGKQMFDSLLGRNEKFIHLLHVPKAAGSSIWSCFVDKFKIDSQSSAKIKKVYVRDLFHEGRFKFYNLAKKTAVKYYQDDESLDSYYKLYSDIQLGRWLNFCPCSSRGRAQVFHWHHPGTPCLAECLKPFGSSRSGINTGEDYRIIIPLRDTLSLTYSLIKHLYIIRKTLSRLVIANESQGLRPNFTDFLQYPYLTFFPVSLVAQIVQILSTDKPCIDAWRLEYAMSEIVDLYPNILTFQARYLLSCFAKIKNSTHLYSVLWEADNSEVLTALRQTVVQISSNKSLLNRLAISYLSCSKIEINRTFHKVLQECHIPANLLQTRKVQITATSSRLPVHQHLAGPQEFQASLTSERRDVVTEQDRLLWLLYSAV
jgi:hypothetical protein